MVVEERKVNNFLFLRRNLKLEAAAGSQRRGGRGSDVALWSVFYSGLDR
jgi:hypothetical protein